MFKPKKSEYFLKIIWKSFIVIFLSLLQISFFSLLPWPFNFFNLFLPIIFFITIILDYQQGLWFAFGGGLIIDLFSFSNFGSITMAIIFAVVAINALFNNFFTNRSFYSLVILGFLGNIFYIIFLLIFNFLFFIFNLPNILDKFFTADNLYGILWQLFFSVLLLTLLFFIFNFLNKKLKSVFY